MSLRVPNVASVIVTAKAIVGTAMNWNKRVKTVAIKLAAVFIHSMPSIPSTPPMTSAPSHSQKFCESAHEWGFTSRLSTLFNVLLSISFWFIRF